VNLLSRLPFAAPRRRSAIAVSATGLLALSLSLAAAPVRALPMASQDFWMVMGDFDASTRELSANFAVTGRDAIGVTAARFDSLAHGPAAREDPRDVAGLTYTRLVRRWNLPDAQANLWFVGAAGGLRGEGLGDGTRTWVSPTVLADYETTRVYLGGGLEAQRAGDWRRNMAYARTGFSFYEVEYEEVQPWLLLEVKRERERVPRPAGLRHDAAKTEWMPMLRLIHRRWFVEFGANRDTGRVSFMWVP
jgi:hypothetical protein